MATTLRVSARTSTGLVRPRNEDAFLVADVIGGPSQLEQGSGHLTVGAKGALLAVSDGMGGHKAGDVASSMTLDSLYRALARETSEPTVDARLERAAEAANEEVFMAGRRPSLAHMGATLTAVLVVRDAAYIAEVGDSRAYVIRNGVAHRLTSDQSLAEIARQAGVIQAQEAAESPMRNVLAQAIGQASAIHVALSLLELRLRDCLVLASDGLTNKVSDEEIAREVASSPTLSAASANLIKLANARGGEDNITVLLAGISEGPHPAEAAEAFAGTFRVLKAFDPATHLDAISPT
jgi:serine/threonine protein phosphatase PrpC